MYIPTTSLTQGGGDVVRLFDSKLGADAANFDVTGISSSYKHLFIMFYGRSTLGANTDSVNVRFNNDSGTNYSYVNVGGTAAASLTAVFAGTVCANNIANGAGWCNIWVPDYTDTTFYHLAQSNWGYTAFGVTSGTNQHENAWDTNNVAINRVTVFGAANWKAGSRLTVYGLA